MENENDFSFENGMDITPTVERFESMLTNKTNLFFDVDEFENLLEFYNSKSNFKKSIIVAKSALNQHPLSATLLVAIAQLYSTIHKPQEALQFLNKAEAIEPFNFDLFYTKGGIFSQLRKSEKAIENYKKALKFSEKFEKEDILLQLAFEYENLDKHYESITYLQEILEHNTDNETALYELGFCYDISEQIEEGKNYFQRFVDRTPYSYIGWYNLGITYSKLCLLYTSPSPRD